MKHDHEVKYAPAKELARRWKCDYRDAENNGRTREMELIGKIIQDLVWLDLQYEMTKR